ncbi:MAG: hypothetical protein P1V34_00240, partial [Alphaproteobacteria bacterium]|nr:hypothetical protein [Alphaproteobacteria bacterium]
MDKAEQMRLWEKMFVMLGQHCIQIKNNLLRRSTEDRVKHAVLGLGASRAFDRIVAILLLEQLARNYPRFHVQIVQRLCAFIRENAPASSAVTLKAMDNYDNLHSSLDGADWDDRLIEFQERVRLEAASLRPAKEIQVALTVLGRRGAEGRRL